MTYHTIHNVYAYSAGKFWPTCGIAISAATLVSLLGIHAILSHRIAYNSNFSPIFIFIFARQANVDAIRYTWGASTSSLLKASVRPDSSRSAGRRKGDGQRGHC